MGNGLETILKEWNGRRFLVVAEQEGSQVGIAQRAGIGERTCCLPLLFASRVKQTRPRGAAKPDWAFRVKWLLDCRLQKVGLHRDKIPFAPQLQPLHYGNVDSTRFFITRAEFHDILFDLGLGTPSLQSAIMDSPPAPQASAIKSADAPPATRTKARSESISHRSDDSHTAAEYVLGNGIVWIDMMSDTHFQIHPRSDAARG